MCQSKINRTNTHCGLRTSLGRAGLLSLQCAGATEQFENKLWINVAGESWCCAYYRGGNDATGLAFTNCLMVVFPSGRLSSECQRIKKISTLLSLSQQRTVRTWRVLRDNQLDKTAQTISDYHWLLLSHIHFPFRKVTDGCLPPVELKLPPPLFILSYADLFMNTPGSGDHIPSTTSGLDFQCSTYTVSPNVSLGCQGK